MATKSYQDLEAEVKTLTADLAAANKATTEAKDANAAVLGTVERLQGEAKQHADAIKAKDEAITAKDAEIKALKDGVKTVEQKAVELVAQVNHKPAQIDTKQNPENSESKLKQYQKLMASDPREAGRFYAEHEAEILAEASSK